MKNLLFGAVAAFAIVAAPVAAIAQDADGSTTRSSGFARNALGGSSRTDVRITAERMTTIRQKLVVSGDERNRVSKSSLGGVSISVGAKLPRERVRISRLPTELVQIAPEYSGYEYFVTDDGRIVIVDPDSYEIVDVIAA